jgi:hypothetical protein
MGPQRASTRSLLWSRKVRDTLQESQGVIHWTSDPPTLKFFMPFR